MTEQLGNGAAIVSCFLWAFSILMFQPLLKRHGAPGCNLFKSCLAGALFTVTSAILLVLDRAELPGVGNSVMLLLSGFVGMAVGDFAFFAAIVRIGARQATLIHATSPVFLLVFSIFNPDETLLTREVIGVLLVVLGVMDVTRRQRFKEPSTAKDMSSGALLALVAALSQAIGIILAKEALEQSHPVLGANVRLFGAAAGMLLIMASMGRAQRAREVLVDLDFLKAGFLAVFFGTYLGIGTMMLAIGLGKTAIIGALLSLTPVFLVPMAAFMEKTRLDWRIFAGTVVAVAGVVLVSL